MKSSTSTILSLARRGFQTRQGVGQLRFTSSKTQNENEKPPPDEATAKKTAEKLKKTSKSMAELDEEMKQAMENMSGEGGEYGLELEGGKPVSMKRGVKDNMFRYI
ncbi:hypothetical protein H2200_003284 [Cladophialophora chaetospira]|uniref:Uncharacterized protein n=1 Tax=Cladophialophora chaetospira TaxID=386627 RepID=A0AA39CM50_9EURO|nr:hypothetical protein H2200_003284 [Cladophialophora chaetospira]